MMTVQDIFEAFGGPQAIAKMLGVSAQAVYNMKPRGFVPSRHWPALVSEAKTRIHSPEVSQVQIAILERITFEALAAMLPAETSVMPTMRAAG